MSLLTNYISVVVLIEIIHLSITAGIVELWVISFLEIDHIFPLKAVDINELSYLCGCKRAVSIGLVTAIIDGESQSSKEVNTYV